MLSRRELRSYPGNSRVWVGRYKNLTNLPHWHNDIEIIYAEEGNANIFIEGSEYSLLEGSICFISSCKTHYIEAERGSILSFILFDDALTKKITAGKTLISPLLSDSYDIVQTVADIKTDISENSALGNLSANNRVERLVLDFFKNEKAADEPEETNYMHEKYKRLIKEIDGNYSDYSLEKAAGYLALSESYFPKFFKKMSGITFSQYLNLVRTEKAVEMIHSGNDFMAEISISCGFGTIRNFNRVFKDITGYSPKKLPKNYDILGLHPIYAINESFNPTSSESELL